MFFKGLFYCKNSGEQPGILLRKCLRGLQFKNLLHNFNLQLNPNPKTILMKTIFYLCSAAIISLAAVSCTKQQVPANNEPNTVVTDPVISSKIFTKTNDPAAIEFGTGAVLNTGSRVAIYLPYVISNEVLQSATLTLMDANTEETLGTFNFLPSSDQSAATLNIPGELWYVPFMFAAVDLDNTYSGRTITIITQMSGQVAVSNDVLPNAFTVQ